MGRPDIPAALQVADITAMQWAADNRLNEAPIFLMHVSLPPTSSEGDEIQFNTELGTMRLAIAVRARIDPVQGNCSMV